MRFARSISIGFSALCALALAACGGGGYGSGGTSMGPAAGVTIAVQPTTIVQGQSATLTWSSTNAVSCTASGSWTGTQALSGTLTVSPTTTGASTYTLTCSGDAYSSGGGTGSATLTVNAPTAYSKSNLISDGFTTSVATDTRLVNPWGIAFGPTTPVWVANNGTQTSTLYDGTGNVLALVVSIPVGSNGPANPTGIVFNGTADFAVTANARTAAPPFIFSGEGGTISGWSPTVDGTHAVIGYDDLAGGAVYKGLAIANNGTANFLYATDFHNNKVVVFDKNYAKVATTGGFTDTTLPAGYAPFGIQALQIQGQTRIVVTYAKQDQAAHDDVPGAGLGLVNVFDANGTLIKHLVAVGGALNAPWGIALAPANFGTLSNALLVGNFGDGVINGYDATTGQYLGTVKDANGTAIALPGLWGIAFGNGARNQPTNTLYFAAGPNGEANGLYGRIDLGATAPDIVPPTVALTAPAAASSLSGTVQVTANAADNVGVAQVQFFAGTTSIGISTTAPFAVNWNTTQVANGNFSLTAQAKDAFGNITTSAAVAVTVNNVAPPPVLFSNLYTQIFSAAGTGHCAGCHTGVGGALPGSMNLSSAANAYAAFVGVASIESPTLQRVKASDAANSYLINKLEGVNIGTTNRMPLGGPFLDQATIDQVILWINQGAANN